MSKKTSHTQPSPPFIRRHKRVVILIGLLISLMISGGVLAQWSGLFSSANKPQKAEPPANDLRVEQQSLISSSPAKEYIYAGGRLLATEEPQTATTTCTYSVSPTPQNFTQTGGTGNISVTALGGCNWTAASNAAWLTINSGSSGTGNGNIAFTVAPNFSGARQGTITVSGAQGTPAICTINQDAASICMYGISPTSQNVPASGGTNFSVNVTATAGCSWGVTGVPFWVTLTSASSGTGNDVVTYNVLQNFGNYERYADLTIAGQTYRITQAVATGGCTYSISPTVVNNVPACGGSTLVTITGASGCNWTTSSSLSWITFSAGGGTGNSSVNVIVAANPEGTRTGVVTIAGKSFTVTQKPGPCGGGGGTGNGTGLKGEYYNFIGQANCGTLVYTHNNPPDATVNYDWGTGGPGGGVNDDYFMVRWTGQVEARSTEQYIFTVVADDGVRLWVDNQLLIDGWRNQAPTTYSGTFGYAFTAGSKYDIRLEYYEWTNGAIIQLKWQTATIPQEIIPQGYLYPSIGTTPQLYEGWLETVSCSTITGWALDRNSLGTTLSVALYKDADTTPFATVSANQARPDLNLCIGNNNAHGFVYTVPANSPLRDGNPHTVRAKYAGTSLALSGGSQSLTCTGQGTPPPTAPSNLTATAVTPTYVALRWDDNSNNENGFTVERKLPGGNYISVGSLVSNATSFTDTNVFPGTYVYRVSAFNDGGPSPSNELTVIVPGGTDGPPLPPTGLTATFYSNPPRIALTWNDVATNESFYQILRKQMGRDSDFKSLNRIAANSTSYIDGSALAKNTTYKYRVVAFNGYGGSDPAAAEVTITTPATLTALCASVSAFSGGNSSSMNGYGYTEGAGTAARWRSPSAAVTGVDPVSGVNALFIADTENHAIRMLYLEGPAAGQSIPLAGSGIAGFSDGDGDPMQARFNYPQGIAAKKNASGMVIELLIADTDNHCIRRLLPPLGRSRWRVGAFSGTGRDGPGYRDNNAGGSLFNSPHGIAIDTEGLVYVADTDNGRIRLLNQEGYSATFYNGATAPSGLLQAAFTPIGITISEKTGDLFVSDLANHYLYKLTNGNLQILTGAGQFGFADGKGTAAMFNTPYQIVWGWNADDGYIFIADLSNDRIRAFDITSGDTTTWAGSGSAGYQNGGCSTARFHLPSGLAIGAGDEIYVIEKGNNTIRVVQ